MYYGDIMILNRSIFLKVPKLEELKFTELLLSDPETMRFNEKWGGTVSFPKKKWNNFYEDYINNPDRHYFHIYNLEGIFVGEVSTKYDESFQSYVLNIKVLHRFRGNNHGFDALEAFLTFLFEDVGVEKIVDNVGHDSVAGIHLLKQFGFIEKDTTDEYVLLELKREDF